MNAKHAATDSIEQHVSRLGSAELDEQLIGKHLRPLFSRSLQHSEGLIYLANHSLGRALDRTEDDVREGLGHWYRDRENAWALWLEEAAAFRQRLAALLHAPRPDCVVPRTSAGQGLRTILNCYDTPIRVMTSADEFNSIDHILKAYARRGRIRLTRLPPKNGRLYRIEDVLDGIQQGTDLVVVSLVMFTTGQLLDGLPALIDAAHERGAKVLLDLYHAAGAVPVDVAALAIDFAIGGSYKYLRGGPGAGWLYLHPRHLDGRLETLDTGWFAEPEPFAFARPAAPELAAGGNRFLESTPAVLPFYQARAGQKLTLAIGVERLRRYSLKQQHFLEALLQRDGIPFLGRPEERGAFIAIPDPQAPQLAERLEKAGVICDAREGLLRFCPDILNTREELSTAVARLAEIRRTPD
ncbi:MAG: aminotransferase class V-fold PLP-dependent enzyme [Gammaproteobacteria bacterium]